MEVPFPPTARLELDGSVRDYWLDRLAQHTHDGYAGVPMSKFPEDLRTYEHLLWWSKPDVVVELGCQFGGSSLWFRDRLRTLASYGEVEAPRVIAIDLEVDSARAKVGAVDPGFEETITFLAGDILDPGLPDRVREHVPPGARCLVIEDSAHVYETTAAALTGFADFVEIGGFFIVEDGTVDVEALRLSPGQPRGVLPAVRDWLEAGASRSWVVRSDLELYGLTAHPGGFLQRVGP